MELFDVYTAVVKDLWKYRGKTTPDYPVGLREVDELIWGLHPSELTVFSGRPGEGKTSLALFAAVNLAIKTPVLFLSLELSKEELVRRMIAMIGRIHYTRIRRNNLLEPHWKAIYDMKNFFSTINLVIKEGGYDWEHIIKIFLQQKPMPKILFLDYLQLLYARAKYQVEDLQTYMRNFKTLAREKKISCVIVSQINRAPTTRRNKRPLMEDLKGSGAIEETADTILCNYWEYRSTQKKDREDIKNDMEILVLKNRHGAIGTASVKFEPEYYNFKNKEV